MVVKNVHVQIEFANSSFKACDAIKDIQEGAKKAAANLYARYRVELEDPQIYDEDKVIVTLKIPDEIAATFSVGPHLKGIANHLLKNCGDKYVDCVVGKRILVYTEVVAPTIVDDNELPMVERLEAVAQFSKALTRRDKEAMKAINEILAILEDLD